MGKTIDEINLLLEIFPYSIVLDDTLNIQEYGKSIEKITSKSTHLPFLECFQIQRPFLETINYNVISSQLKEGFYIQHKKSGFLFRGQFRQLSENNHLIFLGSLWVMDIEQLKPFKIQINDFPPYDPTFDYLHVLKQADIHKNELTDLIKKIDNQSALIKKANTELSDAKSQLESIFNEMSDVVYSIKIPEQKVLFVTPSVKTIFNVEINEFTNDFNLWKSLIIKEDKGVLKQIKSELSLNGEFNVKYRIKTSSDKIKWLKNKGKYIYNEKKQPIRIDGVVMDRTHQYLAQETLVQELKLQEALIDIASTYINLDPKNVKNTINQSLEKMGLFVSADRAYIFDYDFEKGVTSNT